MTLRLIISRKDVARIDLKCKQLNINTPKLSKTIKLICDYNIKFQQLIIEKHEDFFEYLQIIYGEKLSDSSVLKEVLSFYNNLCKELKEMEVDH